MQINKNKFEPVSIQSVISAEDKKDKAQPIDEKRRAGRKRNCFKLNFRTTLKYISKYI